jgi:hypothetical protein
MAPDVDRDGRFTPAADGERTAKFTWGIRDRGQPWAFYRPHFMDPREPSGLRLTHAAGSGRPGYRLEHVDRLASRFRRLRLTEREKREMLEAKVPWYQRLFGRSDGSSERLVLPQAHENFGRPRRMEDAHRRSERGIDVGFTSSLADATFFAGGRYSLLHSRRLVPDAVLEAQALLTGGGRDFYSLELLGSYPIDTTARIFAGGALLTDSLDFRRRQLDVLGGVEFALGRFRFRSAFRPTGPVSQAWFDFRIYYFPAW